jgi:hypothetical protein
MRVLFQDEGRFGRISDARCGWAPLPLRPAASSQIVREFVDAYAAVCPADGQMVSLILPWVDARLMLLFLAHTAAQFAGDYCVLIPDGAGWHTAQESTVPANMKLLALPPYSPELNPAEHIWEYIRENDMRNRIFDDLDEVVDLVAVSLHRLHQAPDTLRSTIAFPWIVQAAPRLLYV